MRILLLCQPAQSSLVNALLLNLITSSVCACITDTLEFRVLWLIRAHSCAVYVSWSCDCQFWRQPTAQSSTFFFITSQSGTSKSVYNHRGGTLRIKIDVFIVLDNKMSKENTNSTVRGIISHTECARELNQKLLLLPVLPQTLNNGFGWTKLCCK